MTAPSPRNLVQLRVEGCEDRTVPAAGWTPIPDNAVVVAPEDGGVPKIHLADPVTGKTIKQVIGYDGQFRGGIHSELGDVTGDGTDDLVFAAGPGGGPLIKVVDGTTGDVIANFFAYDDRFRGGIDIAVGDVNGDGFEDVVAGTGVGGAPHVEVFDGQSIAAGDAEPTILYSFFAYDFNFRGGVFVGTGDMNDDGFDDIITGTGVGGGARVIVFDGQTGEVLQNFFAFDSSLRSGVRVGSGDLDGDGRDDVLVGSGPGGGPQVRAFSGADGKQIANFFADNPNSRAGVHVSGRDIDGDGDDDFVTQTRHGNKQHVRVSDTHGNKLHDFDTDVDDR